MKFISLLLFVLASTLQPSYALYSGRVFVDINGNKSFDKGDIPLSGIVVTDGCNTVKSASDGTFILPGYEKTRFITVTTPAGYRIDRHYIPVGKSVLSYDFMMSPYPRTSQDDYRFIQITDTEIHNRGVASNWVKYLKQYVDYEEVAFMIHTGDICYESGLRSHLKVVNSETIGCPVYYGIGNHDLVKGDYGEQLYESIYGPSWYSFDAGNVHYVMTPMAGGDAKPSYSKAEVYNWLKNDLAMMEPGKQLIVFNHDILTSGNDFYFGADKTQYIDFMDYNLKAWIYGHWHFNYVRNQNGVFTVCTATLDKGGIDHSASAFRVFSLTKNSIADMSLHYCFADHNVEIASQVEGGVSPLTGAGKIPLSVNAYHSGAEVRQVDYAFKTVDAKQYGKSQVMTRKSDWNWYAEIAPPVTKKEVEVRVEVKFSDGENIVVTRRFAYDPKALGMPVPVRNWTNLLNDTAHSGSSGANLQKQLSHAWITNIGGNIFMSSPLIADGRIFAASTDDSNLKQQGVCALEAATGKIIWKYTTRNSVKNSIAFDQGCVFAQDADGYLYAIDATDGKLRWEKQMDPASFPYLADGLIAGNGIVYAGTGKGLGAYRCSDGTAIWVNTAWAKNEGSTTTLTLGDNVVTAGAQWSALYGNDARTGELLWKLSKDGLSDRGASATLNGGKFYVISRNSLFVIEPRTGEILKKKELAEFNLNVTSTPLVTDSEIVFGSADKGMAALDKENLDLKWYTTTGQSLVYTSPYTTVPFASVETSPVLSGGIIYFGASDGCLYGLKAGTGEIVWKVSTGAPIFASVALSGNMLVAVDFSGNVYAFN